MKISKVYLNSIVDEARVTFISDKEKEELIYSLLGVIGVISEEKCKVRSMSLSIGISDPKDGEDKFRVMTCGNPINILAGLDFYFRKSFNMKKDMDSLLGKLSSELLYNLTLKDTTHLPTILKYNLHNFLMGVIVGVLMSGIIILLARS